MTAPAILARCIGALREPAAVRQWSLVEWRQAVRLMRRLRLLGRLAEAVDAAGLLADVPQQPREHLVAEQRLSRWRTVVMGWALERVAAVLLDTDYPKVLLKGAAYIGQSLPIAVGRLPSDLDILVPRAAMADAQRRLLAAGWQEAALDDHDQRYYREWSHEAPPMQHPVHAVELDLHHGILPPVAHTTVDTALLLDRLRPARPAGWSVFDPVDQLLHSAAHLFLDAEPRERVRDLVDMDGLCRHFGADPGYWEALPVRAAQLGLSEPLALASHFMQSWLDTPVPESVRQTIARQGPGPIRWAWLLPLFSELLTPSDPDALPPRIQNVAATVVLARYHLQRMPARLLLPHLWHKWRLLQGRSEHNAP
jgi:hypothetical protein